MTASLRCAISSISARVLQATNRKPACWSTDIPCGPSSPHADGHLPDGLARLQIDSGREVLVFIVRVQAAASLGIDGVSFRTPLKGRFLLLCESGSVQNANGICRAVRLPRLPSSGRHTQRHQEWNRYSRSFCNRVEIFAGVIWESLSHTWPNVYPGLTK